MRCFLGKRVGLLDMLDQRNVILELRSTDVTCLVAWSGEHCQRCVAVERKLLGWGCLCHNLHGHEVGLFR